MKSSANQELAAGGAAGVELSLIGNNQQWQDLESESPAGRRYLQATVSEGASGFGRRLPGRKSGPLKSTSFHVFLSLVIFNGPEWWRQLLLHWLSVRSRAVRRPRNFAGSAKREDMESVVY